jgi:hypothetical protein
MPAPDEAMALAALQRVQSLSGAEVDAIIEGEIGPEMLGVMMALARAQFPHDDDATLARRVQLLVLGWLLAREARPQKA